MVGIDFIFAIMIPYSIILMFSMIFAIELYYDRFLKQYQFIFLMGLSMILPAIIGKLV